MRSTPAGTAQGIGLLVVSTLLFAAQDAVTYHLMQTMAAPQIAAVRYFFFAGFAIFYAARNGGLGRAARARRPGLQILRGVLLASELMVFATAIKRLGLAEIHALFACSPLLVTVLSVPLLGETIGWRRWLAVLFGFIGALIILRPGGQIWQPAAGIALVGALLWALYQICTRRAARDDLFATAMLYAGVAGFIWSAFAAGWVWRMPAAGELGWLLALSASSLTAHMLLIKSLELAPAVVLQPFHYLILVWALLLGFILYGTTLAPMTLFGAALVVASGIFIARREYRALRRD